MKILTVHEIKGNVFLESIDNINVHVIHNADGRRKPTAFNTFITRQSPYCFQYTADYALPITGHNFTMYIQKLVISFMVTSICLKNIILFISKTNVI